MTQPVVDINSQTRIENLTNEIRTAHELFDVLGIPRTPRQSDTPYSIAGRLALLREYVFNIESQVMAYETCKETMQRTSQRQSLNNPEKVTHMTAAMEQLDLVLNKLKPQQPTTTTTTTSRGGGGRIVS